ncbi:Vacuolar calcium ion transporter [Symbiodinium microadriaticum]|uniref:Vacuolar calcium ion transporter n=1 Tax=Symbiodinium microadriaticum TaxID=2951 RepID=A0A1Q9EGC3_SYMMI|nr:Vacuolar calcium ion transporter [Symbiodinium microadriaticum]
MVLLFALAVAVVAVAAAVVAVGGGGGGGARRSPSGGVFSPSSLRIMASSPMTKQGSGIFRMQRSQSGLVLMQRREQTRSREFPTTENSEAVEARGYLAMECQALAHIFCNKLMVLLIFVPLGLSAGKLELNSAWIFTFNFLAIVPLAGILGASTEAMASHTGQMIGGLLNATFGNAVEMIMCIQAVKAGLIQVVQGNLLGSVLSNILLVLGMAIFGAGMRFRNRQFNAVGAAANMTCQVVASISICLPTLYGEMAGAGSEQILMISRICSVFLCFVYFFFLFFQLITHANLFVDEGEEEEEGAEASLSVAGSATLLLLCTLVVAACSEELVDSIEGVSTNFGLPKAFIGVILLPIVGNAAEHATAVTSAYKGKLDLAIGVAVGSSTQIALFVVPVAVLAGWAYGTPMSLNFRLFDTACQMLSVFLVSQVLQHGNTNWLHGAMLVTTYCLIAIMTWFIPEST